MAEPFVTLEEAKAYLRIDHTDDDVRLGILLRAAQRWALDECRLTEAPTSLVVLDQFKTAALLKLEDLFDGSATGERTLRARELIDSHRVLRV
ncbi:head-tail connector protein [Microvirga sp. BSC39]|uniref:head-tail connector protein n=1 Tax=Microvirga sp. BSC39 TaxID=1549810 RepID=UPI00068DE57C|nr:head-tail connector protein [Microvirga sp. BSC39]